MHIHIVDIYAPNLLGDEPICQLPIHKQLVLSCSHAVGEDKVVEQYEAWTDVCSGFQRISTVGRHKTWQTAVADLRLQLRRFCCKEPVFPALPKGQLLLEPVRKVWSTSNKMPWMLEIEVCTLWNLM